MLEYVVHNREELIAAIKAASQPTYAEARNNPVRITNGSTVFKFKEGIQEDRGLRIISNIRAISKKAFDIQ
jgi:hypothetical protein